jgi:hypothetical protein
VAKQRINIDPADYPMSGNKKSPKEMYKDIRDDEKMAARTDVRGSNLAAAMRLAEDSKKGRYANPEYGGDLGQFLMSGGRKTRTVEQEYSKGGYTKAADGCCKRGKTRGKML